jgi:hypothetical protein
MIRSRPSCRTFDRCGTNAYVVNMTLILTAMNQRCVIQISDRRLTANGILVDDEANKAISLTTPDARLTLGFTGLARAGTFDTRDWIMEAVNTAAIIDASAWGIITRFANIATQTFKDTSAIRRLTDTTRRLEIVFAGYSHAVEPPLMVYACVTNAHGDSSIGEFRIDWSEEQKNATGVPAWLSTAGNDAALQDEDVSLVVAALKKKISPKNLQAVLHSRMVKIADRPASRGLIGKQFDTIILERSGGPVTTMYDSSIVKDEVHMASAIFVHGPSQVSMYKDLLVRAGNPTQAMVVPRVHRNAPCPCGSRVRYRECHGRT